MVKKDGLLMTEEYKSDEGNTKKRTNAERSAVTQKKIIEAAIQCLCDYGYSGCSINLVAKQAGISKGAMLHHYSTKCELMISVAHSCIELHTNLRREILENAKPGKGPMSRWVDSSREIIKEASYVALMEITMATRNDAELADQFEKPKKILSDQREMVAEVIAKELGIKVSDDLRAMINLHGNSLKGIAIAKMIDTEQKSYDKQFELIEDFENSLIQKLIDDEAGN